MKFLIDDALNLLDLEAEAAALQTLADLQACWPDIRQRIPEFSDADDLFALLMQFDEHIEDARAELAALGIDVDDMLELSRRLKDVWDESLPDALRKLLRPVADFSASERGEQFGEVQWRPLRVAMARTGRLAEQDIGFRARLNAKAAVAVEAGAMAPLDMQPGMAYLRLGFGGDLSAGAQVDIPLRFGSFAQTARDAAAELNFWFGVEESAQNQPFIAAAAAMTRHLPNPFSFADLWKAADHGLSAVRLQTRAGFAQQIAMRFSLRGLAGDALTGNSIDLDQGMLEFAAGVVRDRNYDLLVRAVTNDEGDKRLQVAVNRRSAAERLSAGALSISLDFRELAQQARGVFDGALEEFGTLRKHYGKYLMPGTLLREELRPELDRAVRQALTGDSALEDLVRAMLGDERAKNAVLQRHLADVLVKPADAASAKAAGLLDQGVGLLSAGADKVAERLIERIGAVFDDETGSLLAARVSERAARAHAALGRLAAKLQGIVDAYLEAEVTELFETGGARARRAFAQIDAFREHAGQSVIDAGRTLDAALTGVRGFIATVDAKAAALTAALSDATRQRLLLRIASEERLSAGAAANVELEFSANRANVRRLYDKLTRGAFDADALEAVNITAGVEPLSGRLEYFAASHAKRAVEVGVLGFFGSEASVFDSRVSIRADIDGNIVVDSDLATSRSLGGVRERQQISFLSPFDLHAARQTRVLTASLTASQEDANFEPAEIEDFLDDFARMGLIGRSTLADAVAQLAQWRDAAGNDDFKARVDVTLALDAEAIDTLLESAAGMPAGSQTAAEGRLLADREMLETVFDALIEAGAYESKTIDRAAKRLRDVSRRFRRLDVPVEVFLTVLLKVLDDGRASRESKAFMAAPFGHTRGSGKVYVLRSRRGALGHAYRIHVLAKGFAVALRTLQQIYAADPSGATSFRALAKKLDSQNALVAFCVRAWLRPSRKFLWLPNDELHAVSHAFFLALAMQSGMLERAAENESVMSVVLRVPGEFGKTRVF